MEPVFHLDMLSADELAGQNVSLLPAATPPSVNQGLVLNGTTQYARVRNNIILPQQISIYRSSRQHLRTMPMATTWLLTGTVRPLVCHG